MTENINQNINQNINEDNLKSSLENNNNNNIKAKIVIAAAGTGGHVFPGLAIAKEMQAKGCTVEWLGCQGLEKKWVESDGLPFHAIEFSGVRGKGLLKLFKAPFLLVKAILQAKRILQTAQPKLVLTMGGYVSVPAGIAARLLGIPLIIHEQNAVAGLSNKILHKIAQKTLVGFEGVLAPSIYTGNPVRMLQTSQALKNSEKSENSENSGITINSDKQINQINQINQIMKLKILVLGGSLGAKALNEVIPQALALLPKHKQPIVVHQAGAKHIEALKQNYKNAGVDVHAVDFIEKMQEAYDWADLVISRAGAMTIAELSTMGVPAILVPYPHAVDDHQSKNAELLVKSKAAWCMAQAQLTPEALADVLNGIELSELKQMAQKAKLHSQDQAAKNVCDVCWQYL